MFSFTCNFRDGRTLPCVQYIASLALVEAVKEYTAHVQGRVGEKEVLPGLKIKWPNDLYYGNQKAGYCATLHTAMVPSVQLLESDSTCIIRNQRYVWPTFLNSMSHKV